MDKTEAKATILTYFQEVKRNKEEFKDFGQMSLKFVLASQFFSDKEMKEMRDSVFKGKQDE